MISQLRVAAILLKENGVRWTSYFFLRKICPPLRTRLESVMRELERRHNLPGMYSRAINYERWNQWDWSQSGEEWTVSEEWKRALVDHVMFHYIPEGGEVLEIGPGGGRWTEHLAPRAKRLVIVDLSDKCIAQCRERFVSFDHIEYYVNNGCDLKFLSDASIDHIWSFDVFVHIHPGDIDVYLGEIRRVLKPGGIAVIHHAREAGARGGSRSPMTDKLFVEMLERHQLTLLAQFDSWGENGHYDVKHFGDCISVFRK